MRVTRTTVFVLILPKILVAINEGQTSQLNYTVGEKELLEIMEGFKAFEGRIIGTPFEWLDRNH